MFLAGKVEERGKRVSEIVHGYYALLQDRNGKGRPPARDSEVTFGAAVVVDSNTMWLSTHTTNLLSHRSLRT